jgi:hypothetical protein
MANNSTSSSIVRAFSAKLNICQRRATGAKGGNLGTVTKGYIRTSPVSTWIQWSPMEGNLFLGEQEVTPQQLHELFRFPNGVQLIFKLDLKNVTLMQDGAVIMPLGSDIEDQKANMIDMLDDTSVQSITVRWTSKLIFSRKQEAYIGSAGDLRLPQVVYIEQATIELNSERVEIGGDAVEHVELIEAIAALQSKKPTRKGLARVQERMVNMDPGVITPSNVSSFAEGMPSESPEDIMNMM